LKIDKSNAEKYYNNWKNKSLTLEKELNAIKNKVSHDKPIYERKSSEVVVMEDFKKILYLIKKIKMNILKKN